MFNIDEKKMQKVVSGFQIPAQPEILSDIKDEMAEDEPNIELLSSLISSDVGLSAGILKIINSPFYGMNRKISEIKQAVMMLGLTVINNLVTALLLKASFKGDAAISLEQFWEEAVDVANAMTFIGKEVKNEIPVDMLYSIGLFHNCGIPLLALKYDDYDRILIEAGQQQVNSISLEQSHYGTNHATVGYFVASSWHLPKSICNLIAQHHEHDYLNFTSGREEQLMFVVLKIAENLVVKVRRFHESADWPLIKDKMLGLLDLSETEYNDLENDFFELYAS